jgi:hypothetical protein
MRAKVKCNSVTLLENYEELEFSAVCKSGSYGADGSEEDNTYAKYTPGASFKLTVTNPLLWGQHKPGQKYYVDFTPVSD